MTSCNSICVRGRENAIDKCRSTFARSTWYIPGVVWYAIVLLAHMHNSEQAMGAAPTQSNPHSRQSVHRFQASYLDKRPGSKLGFRSKRFCEIEQYLAFGRHRMRLRGGQQHDGEVAIPLAKFKLHGRVVDAGVPAHRLDDKTAERIINEVCVHVDGGDTRHVFME